jgi:hypothetical protein
MRVMLSSPLSGFKVNKGFDGSVFSTPLVILPCMRRTVIALLLLASSAFAAPNLTGEWKLDLSRSQYGSVPTPIMVTRKIKHEGVSLSLSTYQKTAQREATSDLNYTTDGKVCVNKTTNGEAKGTAKWDGSSLVIESTQQVQGAELKSREVWSLSSDGKTLTIVTHLTLPQQGEFDVKQVFEKQ